MSRTNSPEMDFVIKALIQLKARNLALETLLVKAQIIPSIEVVGAFATKAYLEIEDVEFAKYVGLLDVERQQ